MPVGEDTYLLSHEVAEIFGISTQTLYNWLKKGKIAEPKRHPVTSYRLWTPRDVERIRDYVAAEKQQT